MYILVLFLFDVNDVLIRACEKIIRANMGFLRHPGMLMETLQRGHQ
jgi:hypothetical protein